MVNYEKFMTR